MINYELISIRCFMRGATICNVVAQQMPQESLSISRQINVRTALRSSTRKQIQFEIVIW